MKASQAARLSPTGHLMLAAVAYQQPIARERLSRPLGRAISRGAIGRLKRLGLIGAGPRLPQVGAALTSMTKPAFVERFGLTTLRDLPDSPPERVRVNQMTCASQAGTMILCPR